MAVATYFDVEAVKTDLARLRKAIGLCCKIDRLKSVSGVAGAGAHGVAESITTELRKMHRSVARVDVSGYSPRERLEMLALRGDILMAIKAAKQQLRAA